MVELFDPVPIDPSIAALPKVELHLHSEADGRLDRILARRAGVEPFDWTTWARHMVASVPPGMPRLRHWWQSRRRGVEEVDRLDADAENFIERMVDALDEAAADGAIYVEIRLGVSTLAVPDFLALFREAEHRAQQRWPRLRAQPLVTGLTPSRPERWELVLPRCLEAARHGLAGIDIVPDPYDCEADWRGVGDWTALAAAAGLGITVHAGEFSEANIVQAAQLPGATRLGHAVFAAASPYVLDVVLRSSVTVECCLSCNVLLGGAASYQEHPIHSLIAAGVPVTLNADDPLRVCTTIGREYAIAAALGFSIADLREISRAAIRASFTPPARKHELLSELELTTVA